MLKGTSRRLASDVHLHLRDINAELDDLRFGTVSSLAKIEFHFVGSFFLENSVSGRRMTLVTYYR